MNKPDRAPGATSLLIFALGLLLFSSPLTQWWAEQNYPWFAPFGLWLALIILIGLFIGRGSRNEL
ncbi:hypothetical protein GH984_01910 [Spiribacter sp. C176]|uniref:DUF5668 domain-containing protein n=1 Tax=Spiribacter salilacus TaxID=2664894 RepID=A0A6N7QLV2_9GAMM|nr:hypothetical protein [Spiribacter salilacus]MRH77466.1 hypothetical protein [Spiribacter salilacus]